MNGTGNSQLGDQIPTHTTPQYPPVNIMQLSDDLLEMIMKYSLGDSHAIPLNCSQAPNKPSKGGWSFMHRKLERFKLHSRYAAIYRNVFHSRIYTKNAIQWNRIWHEDYGFFPSRPELVKRVRKIEIESKEPNTGKRWYTKYDSEGPQGKLDWYKPKHLEKLLTAEDPQGRVYQYLPRRSLIIGEMSAKNLMTLLTTLGPHIQPYSLHFQNRWLMALLPFNPAYQDDIQGGGSNMAQEGGRATKALSALNNMLYNVQDLSLSRIPFTFHGVYKHLILSLAHIKNIKTLHLTLYFDVDMGCKNQPRDMRAFNDVWQDKDFMEFMMMLWTLQKESHSDGCQAAPALYPTRKAEEVVKQISDVRRKIAQEEEEVELSQAATAASWQHYRAVSSKARLREYTMELHQMKVSDHFEKDFAAKYYK